MKLDKPVRLILGIASSLAMFGGAVGLTQAQEPSALLVKVDGVITPVTERFIARVVDVAENTQAQLLIIQLDTPGGLLESTRTITQHLLEADVPSVVYIAPRGARAASAGAFIAAAANFAVMAPGTNLGAASPVSGTSEELPDTVKSKVFNDAAAQMRSIANLRGRSQEGLESMVLAAAAFSAEEALEAGIVDFIAGDLEDLLLQLDGHETMVKPPMGSIWVVNSESLSIREMEMSAAERFLNFLSNPNVAYLLLSLGSLGVWMELVNPGSLFPGLFGAIMIILAFVAFGTLSVNWAAVMLIFLAIALAVLEFYVAGYGVLGVSAVASFILGGILLFSHTGSPSPTMSPIGVSPWVLGTMAGFLSGITLLIGWAIVNSRQNSTISNSSPTSLLGEIGEVVSDLEPRGIISLRSELWTAVSGTGEGIKAGELVAVVKVDDIILTVAKSHMVSE